MSYLALKHLHITCVVLSGCGFVLRGVLMIMGSPLLTGRAARILPHIIDTALLSSAVALAVWSQQYPLAQPWLTAKVLGLLVYILLGTLALKRAATRSAQIACWFLALAVFGYIVSVALSRNVLGWLAWL